MRIAVIGAGAVGGFLGSIMGKAGHDVGVLARGAQLDAIRERGLRLRSRQLGDAEVQVRATDEPSELGASDLAIVAVKMYDFAAAAESAKLALAGDGVGVTFQNGLDAPYELAEIVGKERVLTGTIAGEFALEEPGLVVHSTPMHSISLAELEGRPTPRVEQLAAAMRDAGLTVTVVEDGMQALWQKACGLIPFATITAAADTALAGFMAEPAPRDVWEALLGEVVAVADARGYDIRQAVAGWRAFAQRGVELTPEFTSSLARDFQAGRRTELEWLTGKIVRLGAEKGVPVPTHRALYGLLKIREGKQSPLPLAGEG